ncbi:MAG: DUF1858 domain-containing protein [Candidatus Margulisiibacteriota bacterium]
MSEENKITGEMTIADALKKKPAIAAVLMGKGMHCLGCVIAQGETVAQAAEVHGLPVEELLIDLNKA